MKKLPKQNYLVKDVKGPITSKRNDASIYWEIVLEGCDDNEQYHTYVDKKMVNFENWENILNAPNNNYELSGLRIKSMTKKLINADSKVTIVKQRGNQFFNFFSFEGQS